MINKFLILRYINNSIIVKNLQGDIDLLNKIWYNKYTIKINIARGGEMVSRKAHNLEIVGSIPTPATPRYE